MERTDQTARIAASTQKTPVTAAAALLGLTLGLTLGSAGAAYAGDSGIYTWVDEKGNYHMVDSINSVPKKYRDGARARATSGTMAGDGGNFNVVTNDNPIKASAPAATEKSGNNSGASSGTSPGAASADAKPKPLTPQDKGYWTARIGAARALKAQAEQDIANIEPEMLRLRTLTPPGFHQSLMELDTRRTELQLTLDSVTVELNETIPADARKAGVPSAWIQ